MLIGYMRVSKADGVQALDPPRDALLAIGVDPARLCEDQASGNRNNRPGLEACLKSLRPDDTLVAWRLGRDLRHLVNLAYELAGRGAGLQVLACEGATIDAATPNRIRPNGEKLLRRRHTERQQGLPAGSGEMEAGERHA